MSRHYCNDACKRGQAIVRAQYREPMPPLPRLTVIAAVRGIMAGVCLGVWFAVLFYGLPFVFGGSR